MVQSLPWVSLLILWVLGDRWRGIYAQCAGRLAYDGPKEP